MLKLSLLLSTTMLWTISLFCQAENIPALVADLSEQRAEAASLVKDLIEQQRTEKLSLRDLVEARKRYTAAQISLNAWLDGIVSDIAQGGDYEKNAGLQRIGEEAAAKVRAFMKYGREKTRNVRGGPVTVGAILAVLTEVGIRLYKEYQNSNEAKRRAMIEALANQKWVEFDAFEKRS